MTYEREEITATQLLGGGGPVIFVIIKKTQMFQAVICTSRRSYRPRVCRITKIMWFSLSPVSGPACLGGPEAWPQSHGLDSVLQKWKRSDWTPRTSDWSEPGRTKETQQQRWLLDLHPRWVCLHVCVCVVCHNKLCVVFRHLTGGQSQQSWTRSYLALVFTSYGW